jgi:hypothetical protein
METPPKPTRQDFENAATQDEAAPQRLCKCGRAPWRKGQRNCGICNREANKRYRESLKWQSERRSAPKVAPP